MASAGEVPQEIGRAYVRVLTGGLVAVTERRFRCDFTVLEAPNKVTFSAHSGAPFSFDARGIFSQDVQRYEVFIESKARTSGADLTDAFRDFATKAYVVLARYEQNRDDRFWFATNVPFGCSQGRRLTSEDFLRATLQEARHREIAAVLGDVALSDELINRLRHRLMICVLTDSFLKTIGVYYQVAQDDNIWDITKALHANQIPTPLQDGYRRYVLQVADLNDLSSPDLIYPGQSIRLPWYGIDWD